ncbi:hypothetical protein Hanom_Chr09g00844381 [Helianthus anomalus]
MQSPCRLAFSRTWQDYLPIPVTTFPTNFNNKCFVLFYFFNIKNVWIMRTSPEGILVSCLTRAPAATMACFSTTTPSRSVAFIPINASSSTVHPCKIAL